MHYPEVLTFTASVESPTVFPSRTNNLLCQMTTAARYNGRKLEEA